MSFPMYRLAPLLLALPLSLVACSAEQADAPSAKPSAESASAQRAYVDPETGALTVPPDTKAARSASSGETEHPAYRREERTDGTVMLRPKQPARHSIEGHVDDEGRLHIEERDRHAH
ncbi:hypothetical protein [Algiphilus sp.]|uniref:hypothetical protein n=1 Tax=Algiphilus sp. TaxID=1872431 RepID=UPI003B525F89